MKDVNVYIFTHKVPPYGLINDEWHTPIHVGKAINDEDVCECADNTGDNISEKNKVYHELTGQYWVWKNAEKSDYVGQEHYRRHFNLTKDEVISTLKDYDIIVPTHIIIEGGLEKHYETFHIGKDLKMCEEIIAEKFPDYVEDYQKYVKNGTTLFNANSFITKWENYEIINDFVFGVLFELENRYGYKTYEDWHQHALESEQHSCPADHKNNGEDWDVYQTAVCGYLAERLLTLCILHNFKRVKEVNFQELEQEYKVKEDKIMLCCIGRKENQYIREFVDFYNAIGVTNICLYDNNRDGEDDFRDVIGDYIDNGFVILKDYRNITTPCQLKAYNECYAEYKNDYSWFLFFDIDEFLFVNGAPNLNAYLADRRFDAYDMIHLNWLCYGDGGQLTNDGRGVLQRFTEPIDVNRPCSYGFPENFHIKSVVRGGLDKVIWNVTPHTPTIDGECCNGTGLKCEGNSPFAPYDYRMAGLRHYTTKTAEEYANKVNRGFCDGNPTPKEKMVELFFKRNEVTKEKVDYFNEHLGIDMSHLLPTIFEGEKRKDVQIYSLCYSKKDFQFMDDAVVTPLQVGAANGTDVCKLKDNMGDNISGANYFYIENTGTYWIWKNVKDAKYKGQMQYRRPLSGISETTNFEELFSKYDVITCEPFYHPDHKVPTETEKAVIPADTVEEGYAFSNCIDDLYILEMAVKIYYPDYSDDWDKYIKKSGNLYYSNGFIMKAEDYDRYSDFLFGCLNSYLALAGIKNQEDLIEHVKYNLEVGKYPRYQDQKNISPEAIKWQTEIGGFLSERIWTLWVQHNFKEDRIYKTPYIKMEENMYT